MTLAHTASGLASTARNVLCGPWFGEMERRTGRGAPSEGERQRLVGGPLPLPTISALARRPAALRTDKFGMKEALSARALTAYRRVTTKLITASIGCFLYSLLPLLVFRTSPPTDPCTRQKKRGSDGSTGADFVFTCNVTRF